MLDILRFLFTKQTPSPTRDRLVAMLVKIIVPTVLVMLIFGIVSTEVGAWVLISLIAWSVYCLYQFAEYFFALQAKGRAELRQLEREWLARGRRVRYDRDGTVIEDSPVEEKE